MQCNREGNEEDCSFRVLQKIWFFKHSTYLLGFKDAQCILGGRHLFSANLNWNKKTHVSKHFVQLDALNHCSHIFWKAVFIAIIYNKLSLKTKNVDKEVIFLKHIILHFANLDVCCCFETSIFNSRNQLLKCQASTSSSWKRWAAAKIRLLFC